MLTLPALWMGLGCAHFTRVKVDYGAAVPVPLVQPSNDRRRWYVPMESEHGPYLWFVDTGYDRTNCDDDFVAELGLATRGHAKIRGEVGTLPASTSRLPSFDLGGHVVTDVVCLVRDLNATSSVRDPQEVPIAGVLGMDVLGRFRLVLDPATGELVALDPKSAAPLDGDANVAKLRKPTVGRRVRVAMQVEGRRLWPVVDTGAARTYVDGRRVGLEPDREGDVTIRGSGGNGSAQRRVSYYRVQDLTVGGQPVSPLTLMSRDRGWWVFRHPGLLGLDVLSQFRQEYDFARGRVRLSPVTATKLPSWNAWQVRQPASTVPVRWLPADGGTARH